MIFRRFVLAVAVVATLSLQLAPSARAAVPDPNEFPPAAVSAKTLANGLKAVVVQSHAAPVVEVAMWYGFGANQETAGKTGLAHALEHMMFRGTPSLSDAGLDDVIARIGAQVNAETNNDVTHFYALVPRDRLSLWLRIEADRMQHLSLNENLWKLERGAVLQEYAADYSDPIGKLVMSVNRAAYGDRDALGRGALGVRSDIEHATTADLRAYYQRWYAPNNAVLVMTGDVKPSDAFALAEQAFGGINRRNVPRPLAKAAAAHSGATIAQTADVAFTTVDFAYAIPGQTDRAVIAPILIALACEDARSPIRSALVNAQIALQYSATPILTMRGSMFHLLITLAPGRTVAQARQAWESTFRQTFVDGYPSDLIDAAKRAAILQDVYDGDSLTGLGELVGNSFGVEHGTYPNHDNADIAHETRAQIQSAARTMFAHPTVVAYVKPQMEKPGEVRPANPNAAAISDTFSGRVPTGKIVEAPWIRAALATNAPLNSHVQPVAYTLPNGLRLLVQEAHDNPTFTIAGRVRNSPRSDPPGEEGLSILLTSMMGYGSQHYDFETERTIADNLGAEVSYGGQFGARGLARDFPQLFNLLADDLKAPALPSEFFSLVRDSIRSQVERRDFDPQYRAAHAFEEALLPPGDPALRQPTAASLNAITLDDVRNLAGRLIRPENTVIVVVGDVNADHVRDFVTSALGDWKAQGTPIDLALPPLPQPKGGAIDVPTPSNDVAVRMGEPGIARGSADFDAFSLLDQIFGGNSFDSRLFKEVRMRRGLAYTVYSALDAGIDRGIFEIGLRASPKNVSRAVTLVKDEMRRMQEEPVAQNELERARSRIVGETVIAEQDKATLVGDLLNIAENDLPLNYYATLTQRYAAIGADAIQRVARTYFHPSRLVEVYEGPAVR
ncbi:MAG: insulinase family protein [Candidatus Eremiobacteraeota bacterium]|nr:insulinase family protein [Candidatus Eremiobacteraeota bacterium]